MTRRLRYPPWLSTVANLGRHRAPRALERGLGWRVVTPLAFIASGVLLVTSSVNAQGTDLRADRYTDLADLARQETQRVEKLQAEVAALNADIEQLSDEVSSAGTPGLQDQIDQLQVSAGMTAVQGPGLTVILEDAPEGIRDTAGDQVSNAIVHQQDIQAVVNAMWAGGAEAMMIQGQRVISTTGIKCVGNTVLLHGVTYSPPYVISAIGDVKGMRATIAEDAYIQAYLQAVDQWQLGWQVVEEDRIEVPAYTGSTELTHARAAGKVPDPT